MSYLPANRIYILGLVKTMNKLFIIAAVVLSTSCVSARNLTKVSMASGLSFEFESSKWAPKMIDLELPGEVETMSILNPELKQIVTVTAVDPSSDAAELAYVLWMTSRSQNDGSISITDISDSSLLKDAHEFTMCSRSSGVCIITVTKQGAKYTFVVNFVLFNVGNKAPDTSLIDNIVRSMKFK